MADGGCDNRGENDAVELEAMCKDTFSWHPCQVSLCPGTLGLIVQYEDNNFEEVISNKDGVLAHVRVRSTPLHGDDCSSIQQGDQVLATQNSQVKEGLFFDAQVKEVIHVRHSKRIHCRCSFKIKWLHRALEEKALTVPASAIKKISTKSISLHSTISAFFCMVESSTNELKKPPFPASVDGMNLEADVNMLLEKQIEEIKKLTDTPDKKFSNNIAFELKVDLKGPTHAAGVESLKDPCVKIPKPNGLNGSVLSDQDLLMSSRSPLSPLAARAALALLRSRFPQSVAVHSYAETGDITSSAADVSKISATLGGKNLKSIVKTIFPTSDSPQEVESSKVCSRPQGNGMEKKRKKTEKRAPQPSEKRVTRSQQNNGIHESTQVNIGETQLKPSSQARRVTRSVAEETENTKFNAAAAEGKVSSAENDKTLVGKDALVDSQKGSFAEASDRHNYLRSITRSAAREVMEKTNARLRLTHGKSSTSESMKLDSSKGNVSPKHNRLETKKPVNSPIPTLKRKSNRDAYTHDNTPPNTTGSVDWNSKGTRKKPTSSKKQATPVSHRPRTRSQK